MELEETEIAPTQIATHTQPDLPLVFTSAADRLKILWRILVRRVGSRRKTLAVRETAALGDRRFVSVIQFERLRFLIGSSPSSITLLAQLPDEFRANSRDVPGEKS